MFDEDIRMDKGIDPARPEQAGEAEAATGGGGATGDDGLAGGSTRAGSAEAARAGDAGGAGAASSAPGGSRCAGGDGRREILVASSEAVEDLVMLEQALAMVADEEAELDAETRQRTLLAGIRLLHDRTALLARALERLW